IERRETGGVQIYPDLKRGSEHLAAYTGRWATTVTVTDFGVLGELLLRLARLEQAAVAGPWWQLRPGSKAGADVRQGGDRGGPCPPGGEWAAGGGAHRG